ncbi:MarR family transcriptional regulator [Streptococcus hyovaginalis]|uniref:MarR family winged helix-turn-helix transcriptional regulator n=1 Tax=Streptococcus hyovaginalis TaxID=149015 RepID=UPI002A83E5FF|nr:MarR family transcriptional regulator [Streptococcus hyovaginalis]MDY4511101.1 MarR family transcriptional regulator [Streptococcus hyovaginalis]
MHRIEETLAFKLLLAKHALIDKRSQLEFAVMGLTRGNFVTLAIIAQYPGITQSELSLKNLKDKNVIGHLVDKLEQKSLIKRSKCQTDRRSYQLFVTDKGQAVVDGNWESFFNHGRTVLTSEEEKTLSHLLEKLLQEEVSL